MSFYYEIVVLERRMFMNNKAKRNVRKQSASKLDEIATLTINKLAKRRLFIHNFDKNYSK